MAVIKLCSQLPPALQLPGQPTQTYWFICEPLWYSLCWLLDWKNFFNFLLMILNSIYLQVYFTDTLDMKVYVRSYGGWMMSVVSKSQAQSLKTSLDKVQAKYESEYRYDVGYNRCAWLPNDSSILPITFCNVFILFNLLLYVCFAAQWRLWTDTMRCGILLRVSLCVLKVNNFSKAPF